MEILSTSVGHLWNSIRMTHLIEKPQVAHAGSATDASRRYDTQTGPGGMTHRQGNCLQQEQVQDVVLLVHLAGGPGGQVSWTLGQVTWWDQGGTQARGGRYQALPLPCMSHG